jgi:hypothetical protein
MSGRFGEPLIDRVPMTSPIYNPSVPYTVPESPEVRVSRQALDQFIAKGLSENESFTSSWVIGDVPL